MASEGSSSESEVAQVVEKTRSRAEALAGDREKSMKLLSDAVAKARTQNSTTGPLGGIWQNFTALLRLLQAYSRKEYTDIPWGSIVMVVIAIIYFVSPVDLVPDVIPVVGFVDDATVIAFVLRQIQGDLDKFTAWEAATKNGAQAGQLPGA